VIDLQKYKGQKSSSNVDNFMAFIVQLAAVSTYAYFVRYWFSRSVIMASKTSGKLRRISSVYVRNAVTFCSTASCVNGKNFRSCITYRNTLPIPTI